MANVLAKKRRTAASDSDVNVATAVDSSNDELRMDDSVTTKVCEDHPMILGIYVQWQLEELPGVWTAYDDSLQRAITAAFNSGRTEFDLDGGNFAVVFQRPAHKTKATGYQKRVRLALKPNQPFPGNSPRKRRVSEKEKQKDIKGFVTWSWRDARQKQHFYSPDSTLALEQAAAGSTSLTVMSEGKSYTVNLVTRLQDDKFPLGREPAEIEGLSAFMAPPAASKQRISAAATAILEKVKVKEEIRKEKTVVVKGKAPLDSECLEKLGKAHVFYEGNTVWDCMLNQTNLQNNNNKFYLIQLIKDNRSNVFSVWMRWGRVGKRGQTSLVACGPDLDEAKNVFCAKFRDKTKNEWAKKDAFTKVPGKYDLLEMDYNVNSYDTPDNGCTSDVQIPASKLNRKIQDLIHLICDVKAMEDAVVEMKYDARKAPLGKLTKSQIKAGYEALKQIETLVKHAKFDSQLTQACNDFYTRIPHDFGMKAPQKISSIDVIKEKLRLLEALSDIEIAVKVLESGDRSANPVDRHYASLQCELTPMERNHPMYSLLENCLMQTHAETHNQYKMELLDIFECSKSGETPSNIGNRVLLWHGSRLTNWVGILAKGLRIAPPEAPVTGYMFGKGIYFSDVSSKSANYCFPTKQKNVGLLLLSEVALGEPHELLSADYEASKLPPGKSSVKGCGKYAPDPNNRVIVEDGVALHQGKLVATGVNNTSGYTLNYNEYIVYSTSQVRMRYLLKVKFNFC